MNARNTILAALALPALAACAASGAAPAAELPRPRATEAVRVPPTAPPAPVTGGFRPARIMSMPGLENVLGQTREGLLGRFGAARLDVWEGDARKLQFTGEACVLDVYLYPPAPGAEPRASYVDARRASDGLDVDRAACVAALARR